MKERLVPAGLLGHILSNYHYEEKHCGWEEGELSATHKSEWLRSMLSSIWAYC